MLQFSHPPESTCISRRWLHAAGVCVPNFRWLLLACCFAVYLCTVYISVIWPCSGPPRLLDQDWPAAAAAAGADAAADATASAHGAKLALHAVENQPVMLARCISPQ